MSAWIDMIDEDQADEELREALESARTPHGTVDNVMRVHSLRPATMVGHVRLYRAALHDDRNEIPAWFQETIASYVSMLNDCAYSLANHWANARHLIGDDDKASRIREALSKRDPSLAFRGSELELLKYAEKLTLNPQSMTEEDVLRLREWGVDDGRILEANQIVGYFSYVNRLLNGLGVSTEGDVIGFYPDDSAEDRSASRR